MPLMMEQDIKIVPFKEVYQDGIDAMMKHIALEFMEPIFTQKSKKIAELYTLSDYHFWVAVHQHKVIGTIGIVTLAHKNAVLKSMFVDKASRGKGVSKLLLDTAVNWVRENGYEQLYLGTMAQFTSAQRFYTKNGFLNCVQKDLPSDFDTNLLDTIFYTKSIRNE